MHKGLVAVLAVLVAGCSSPSAENQAVDDAESAIVLAGLVVDSAITPLQNATVALVGTNHTAATDADGRFAFTFAEEGAVRLLVSKSGYITQSIDTDVAAGQELLRIKLDAVVIPVPTSAVKEWTGIIQCSVRTPYEAYAACKLADDQTGLVGEDADERYDDINTPPTFVQVEMDWVTTQPLGTSLRLMLTDDHRQGTDNYAVATGPSPLMVSADNQTLMFKHLDTQGLYIRVFTGEFQELPLSLTLQQTFTVYTTVFHDYAPDSAWRFTDGNGLPPP